MSEFSELALLIVPPILCTWFFLSRAPRLTRIGVLLYGCALAVRAMAFTGLWALALQAAFTIAASLCIVMWAYRESNRLPVSGAQGGRG